MSKINVVPYLYLDTNVILDAIDNRWQPAVDLMNQIGKKNWECCTSRFTVLEILDVKQEEKYIENLLVEGHRLSRVRDLLGIRRQPTRGLKVRELNEIYQQLYDKLSQEYSFINFEHPIDEKLWDKADAYGTSTNIGSTDAIHLASAITIGCNILVTRDQDFRAIADDFIIAVLPEDISKGIKRLS